MKEKNTHPHLINYENAIGIKWNVSRESFLFDFLYDDCLLSKNLVLSALKERNLTVNGKRIRKNMRLSLEDFIELIFPFEQSEIAPESFLPLEILYEDEFILLVNKPPFVSMYPTNGVTEHTLANLISQYFKEQNILYKVRFINRLDRDTSGIVMIAKNPFAHQQYGYKNRKPEKKYIAITNSLHNLNKGTMTEPIWIKGVRKDCETEYHLLSQNHTLSVFEILLKTGRTHQIRIHFSENGIPLMGDPLYGNPDFLASRQMLHAHSLTFYCLSTGENIEIFAPLPTDMQIVLKNNCLEIPPSVVL